MSKKVKTKIDVKSLIINIFIVVLLLSIILVLYLLVASNVKKNKKIEAVEPQNINEADYVVELEDNNVQPLDASYSVDDYVVEFNIKAPFINLDGEDVANANEEIRMLYEETVNKYNTCDKITTGQEESKNGVKLCRTSLIYYGYVVNKKYLYVYIEYKYGDNLGVYNPVQYVYIFNLKYGKKVTYDEVYAAFNIDKDSVESKVMENYKSFAEENSLTYTKEEYAKTQNAIKSDGRLFISTSDQVSLIYSGYYESNKAPFRLIIDLS